MRFILAPTLLASAVAQEGSTRNSIREASFRDNLRGLQSDHCTLHGAAMLQIPGEHLREDFVYECVENNGQGRPLVMNNEQRSSLDAMVGSGAVELGIDQIDIQGAQRS
eukprot:2789973-Ditylum_brightwellii.AAC.1